MKKLMFGLAAVAAGSAMAIESANVVGYQQNPVENGYSIITPAFENVGEGEYLIDNLIPDGVEDGYATVQVVNPNGSWGVQGFWFNAFGEYPAGWFTDMSGETPADIKLTPGQAVFFWCDGDSPTVQSAGQVSGEVTIDCPNGYSMIGNSSPVQVAIDDITLEGVEDGFATVQVVNPDGSWGAQGFWFNAFDEYPAGWFTDMSGETPVEITLEPGQSVFFWANGTDVKAKLPSALK